MNCRIIWNKTMQTVLTTYVHLHSDCCRMLFCVNELVYERKIAHMHVHVNTIYISQRTIWMVARKDYSTQKRARTLRIQNRMDYMPKYLCIGFATVQWTVKSSDWFNACTGISKIPSTTIISFCSLKFGQHLLCNLFSIVAYRSETKTQCIFGEVLLNTMHNRISTNIHTTN